MREIARMGLYAARPQECVMFMDDQIERIYDRTCGQCHLCHAKLAFCNYGLFGERGAWEVEHSNPRAMGGTNHGNNLFAACIGCNRSKQHGSTRNARRASGQTRSPMSQRERDNESWAKLAFALGAVWIGYKLLTRDKPIAAAPHASHQAVECGSQKLLRYAAERTQRPIGVAGLGAV